MKPPVHPHVLTAARLPLAPVAVVFLLQDTLQGLVVAATLALLLEITDLLDGYVARAYGVVTRFGKLFDPFSDAFCRYTLFLGFLGAGIADLWMVIAIFYRDATISFLRTVAAARSVVIGARTSGKIKAIVQGVGTQVIFLSLILRHLAPDLPWLTEAPWWTMFGITLVTLASLVDYLHGNLPVLRAAWNAET